MADGEPDYEVYYDSAREKWVVERVGVREIETAEKKKTAKNRALGAAQQRANSRHRVMTVDIYTSKNRFQTSKTVSPKH